MWWTWDYQKKPCWDWITACQGECPSAVVTKQDQARLVKRFTKQTTHYTELMLNKTYVCDMGQIIHAFRKSRRCSWTCEGYLPLLNCSKDVRTLRKEVGVQLKDIVRFYIEINMVLIIVQKIQQQRFSSPSFMASSPHSTIYPSLASAPYPSPNCQVSKT